MEKELFSDENEIKSSFVSWGAIGDWVKGTLVSVRERESRLPGKQGTRVKVYELKTKGGSFHQTDDKKNPIEPPKEPKEGEYWTVGGRPGIDNSMRNIKIGQIVGFKFKEEIPAKTKGFSATKVIKVYAGEMDPDWQGETAADVEMP